MSDDLNLNTDSMKTGSGKLKSFASALGSCFGKISSNHQRVSSSVRSDKSGIGSVLSKIFGKTEEATAKAGEEAVRVTDGAGSRIAKSAENHEANEAKQKKAFEDLHPDAGGTGKKPKAEGSGGGGGETTTSSADPKGKGKAFEEPPDLPGGGHPPVTKRPPNATGENSDPSWQANKELPEPKPYTNNNPINEGFKQPKPGGKGSVDARDRGRDFDRVDPNRPGVVKDEDGRIQSIDGESVKDYLQRRSTEQAHASADPEGHYRQTHDGNDPSPADRKNLPPREKTCSALAMDLKTGEITHGVNGGGSQVIPPERMHPLLQQNYQNLRSHEYSHEPKDGGDPSTMHGQAHVSKPAGHAEVKATNELLWKKQAAWDADPANAGKPLPSSAMNDIRVDPRWTGANNGVGGPAPCCANCSTLLDGAGSYTGRYQHDGNDRRHGDGLLPPDEG